MSRKDDSPAISLFSFQDIITSITGIMFLVVIMLLLLLFESKPAKPADPETVAARAALIAEIKELEKSLADFSRQEKELEKLLNQLQQFSPEELEKKKKELEEAVKNLHSRLHTQNEKQRELKSDILISREKIQKAQDELPVIMKKAEEMKKLNAENKNLLARLQKKLQHSSKAVTFSVEKSSDKQFLLAEFAKDGFRVKELSSIADHDLRIPGASAEDHIQRFIQWISSRDRKSELISVIIGPDKLKYWNMIAFELEKLGFSYGVEFYPDDDSSIFTDNPGGEA